MDEIRARISTISDPRHASYIKLYQLDFPVALLQGRVQRRTASILQRLNRAVISPLPLVDRLAAQPVPFRCFCYPVLRRIFQYPLTIVRFLCYSVHGELLCGGWFGDTAILPHEFSFCLLPCYLCIIAQHSPAWPGRKIRFTACCVLWYNGDYENALAFSRSPGRCYALRRQSRGGSEEARLLTSRSSSPATAHLKWRNAYAHHPV